MENNTQVINGWRDGLEEVKYINRRDSLEEIADDHQIRARDIIAWNRWPNVRNTWTYTIDYGDGPEIYTRFHHTDICCIGPDDILYLSVNGYYTPTTKGRLNVVLHNFCNRRVYISQAKKQWWINAFYTDGQPATNIPYYEGMYINREGELIDLTPPVRFPEGRYAQGTLPVDTGLMR
jgi:hypothetical protein